jgi:Ser/Thr protein kinase RdoA (MazF antagonist)
VRLDRCLITAVFVATVANAPAAAETRSKFHRLIHKAEWAGVGTAAHHFAGAPGSVAVGVAKYHEDLAKDWHTRGRAAIQIGVPLAIGAATGLVGSAAYEVFEHRQWIKGHWPWKRRDNLAHVSTAAPHSTGADEFRLGARDTDRRSRRQRAARRIRAEGRRAVRTLARHARTQVDRDRQRVDGAAVVAGFSRTSARVPPDRDEKSGWRTAGDVPAPSLDEAARLIAPWLCGRRLLGIELMAGGLMNRNCRLRIDGSPDAVLRLQDRDPSAAAKEHAILDRLRGSVPVPAVLYADANVLVLELIDGVPLTAIKRSGDMDALAACAFDAGRVLARLQHQRFDRPGLLTATLEVDTDGLPNPLTTASLVEHFAQSDSFSSRVGAELLDALLHSARDWDEHPSAPELPTTLVHGDFGSRNVLVRQVHGRWSVAAILDWEFAFSGPAYVDIGNFLRYERADRPRFEPWFSRGLRDGGLALDGDWRRAARMADLPALCELLSRQSTPADVVAEILELVDRTLD